MSAGFRRWLIGLGVAAAALALILAMAAFLAARTLKNSIENALGPQASVREIKLGLSSVELHDVHVQAQPGWPAKEELSARRIELKPDLRALTEGVVRITAVRIESGFVSLRRSADGRLQVVPSLLAMKDNRAKAATAPGEPLTGNEVALEIGGVELIDGAVDYYDESVKSPPLNLRLENVRARLGRFTVPASVGRTSLAIDAAVKGGVRDGSLSIRGDGDLTNRDSDLTLALRGVELATLQPYLTRAADTGIRRGSLDLDLRSSVRSNQLQAPGVLILHDLELNSSHRFLGLPRAAAVALLKDRDGKISVRFELSGNLDDPRFSLNEHLAGRIAASLAGTLGLGVEGLARGAGETGIGAVRGVGQAVSRILGR